MSPHAGRMHSDRVAGVCVLRNSVDLVPFLCGHYLRAGFARLHFIDDGSYDGTFEYLTKVAQRTGRVSVTQVHNKILTQKVLMNEAANALIAAGYPIIVPFDADEFWAADAGAFACQLASVETGVLFGRWINFVQARRSFASRWHRLPDMRFQTSNLSLSGREGVSGYRQSFVCVSAMKVAFKACAPVELSLGQHSLGGIQRHDDIHPFDIFHLPLRSRNEIVKRGLDYEPRRAPVRIDPGESWQSAFHAKAVADDKVDAVWAANSYDANGRLDIYGVKMGLLPDNRLRSTLARAAWYLFSRFGLWPFPPRIAAAARR
jgi:hypothetical protein